MSTIWLLDVDGVLNASRSGWSAPPTSREAYANGNRYRLRYEAEALRRIQAVDDSGLAEVWWATTWCEHVDELHRVLPVGPFPAAFGKRPAHLTYDEQKIEAALAVLAAGDRLIWTDDSVVGPARLWWPEFDVAAATGRALLIAPQASRGLRPEHLDEIEEFARCEHTCRACPADCGSCTHDEVDCECYEHQDDHPGSVREEIFP